MKTHVQIAPNVFLVRDTCNVYVLRAGSEAILIDFGSGLALDLLDELGVERVTDVLMTHHHRDQGQGLDLAVDAGIRIWVPPVEKALFAEVDEHWQMRPVDNNYDLRQDRFSLIEPVQVAGSVAEYRWTRYGAWDVLTVPTPGHTVGSVSYLVDVDGHRLAFVGDLLFAPGKVWSLAATQWTYSGLEGSALTVISARNLLEAKPDTLLPSHGEPMDDPEEAISLLEPRLQALTDLRRTPGIINTGRSKPQDLAAFRERPYEAITPHLLRNRTSVSHSYALLSDDGAALVIDFGYDMTMELPTGADRSSRRPWLASLPGLRRDYGIDRIEVVVPTHYHDDHVAGFNLLRDVEGTQVWAAANVAPILLDPKRYDLPCLWYEPIPVDRVLPLGQPVRWHEYELTMYELSGHTLYAVAIAFEVDGQRVVATGDQQDGGWIAGERAEFLNYQYQNGFQVDDFVKSAELYQKLNPDLLISGHWAPRAVTDDYLNALVEQGAQVARLHRELLPLDAFDFGAGGFGARLEPYQSTVRPDTTFTMTALLRNPFKRVAEASVAFVAPDGWSATPAFRQIVLGPLDSAPVSFAVHAAAGVRVRRARVAIDLTIDGIRFGQHAEALVTVA
jgi:glyoxylase-like metal-dependent hydrolase (beta-lactamase superfamily II)